MPTSRTAVPASGRPAALLGAVVAPLAVALGAVPFRDRVDATNAALLLVVVVVAVSASGRRSAGVGAALSSGLWFDLLWTRPYGHLRIADRADVETTALLVVVGLAVTALAAWGRGLHAEVVRATAYADGIRDAVSGVPEDGSAADVVEQVCRQVERVLSVERCRFDYGRGVLGGGHPRLRPDGAVEADGTVCDVERFGLPVGRDLEILLDPGGHYLGRFVLSAPAGAHPTLEQRLAAVTLAGRAARVLARH